MIKSLYKNELARLAGVSSRVLAEWIKSRAVELRHMGVRPTAKLLPPIAVDYLRKEFGIDIPEDPSDE